MFVLYGGEDLHLKSTFLTGWKPLGLFLDVTAAKGPVLQELNGKPAYETYYKYLHMKNDENFFNRYLPSVANHLLKVLILQQSSLYSAAI